MTDPVSLYRAASSVIASGGASQIVFYGPLQGGLIVNPSSAVDQGLSVPEVLYVSVVGPAEAFETITTIVLQPGQLFKVPPGTTSNVYVNAASSGHRFSAVLVQPTPSPPAPAPGSFPPSGPTSLLKVIP